MSESKHTPGPWRTDTDIFHDRLDIRDESGRRIAVCMHDYPMSMARHDANAHLIAAAPDLLDALEVARDFIQQGIELGFISTGCAGAELNMDSIDEMLDKFEEAIQKAKGELQ